MKMNTRFNVALQPALLALLLASSAGASVVGTFDRALTVNGPVDIEVLTHSGDISIRNGPAGVVTIHAKIHVGSKWMTGSHDREVRELQQNPPIHQSGNNIRIEYVDFHDLSVDYEITVPTETAVRTHTGSGDQTVEGLKGRIELESGSGDLRLSRLTGEMRFHTGSGNIRAEQLSGPIYGRAGSGDLDFEETGTGDADIETGSGNIHLKGLAGGLRASAGSGDITVAGNPLESWRVHTGSGNVRLHLPSEAAFDVDLATNSGDATIDHPVTTTIQGKVQEGHKTVMGRVRGGGPLLSVRTGSGDVHVE
jgi:Putative adhesin